jgi:CelD/BcsL family acetyltransferase involved in cellulose biosynthesis
MTLTSTIVDDPRALEPHLGGWTALAEAARRPLCLPGWMLAWWRGAAPAGAALRVVLVHDGGELVGVAPFFAQPGRAGRVDYRLLGAGLSHRIGPVGAAGREPEIGRAFAHALAGARPRPRLVAFEAFDAASPWPRAIRDGWPGRIRPHRFHARTQVSPVLPLPDGGFDAWLASRSSNFRQQMRQSERRIEAAGGRVAIAIEPAEIERAVAAFGALHDARWEGRGGSGFGGRATGERLVGEAGRALTPGTQLRLWCAEVDERIVAVQVFVAAGGELAYWNGGWDERYARCRPALATILAAVRDGFARGEQRVDFGGGDDAYKLRFTGTAGDAAVRWSGLFPVDARYPVTRAQLLPKQLDWAARGAVRRLPEERKEQLRRLLRRGS